MWVLCAYTVGDNAVFDEIMEYVIDNTHHAHLNKLVTHMRNTISGQLQIDMMRAQIREHFLAHQCDQKVVARKACPSWTQRTPSSTLTLSSSSCTSTSSSTTWDTQNIRCHQFLDIT